MDEDRAPEMRAVAEAFARTFTDTWNQQDGPAYGSAYWPDAELVDPTGTIWDGRAAIEQMHVDLWNGPARNTLVEANVRRVRALTPSLAVVDLAVSVAGFSPPPPGAEAGADGKVETRLKHVVEKRGTDWKVIASQNTFVAGPPRDGS